MSGWYAEILIDTKSEQAIRAFNNACKAHLSTITDDGHKRVHIEPCVEPLPGQGRNGCYTAKIYAKVSEWGRRLMHSHFVDATPDGDKLLGSPGAMVTDVYERAPAGRCAATVHLMGCWHDKTKTGVHLYLDRVELLPEPPAAVASEVRPRPGPRNTGSCVTHRLPCCAGRWQRCLARRRQRLARRIARRSRWKRSATPRPRPSAARRTRRAR